MAYVDPILEQRRAQLLGRPTSAAPSVSTPGFDTQFEQRRAQMLKQGPKMVTSPKPKAKSTQPIQPIQQKKSVIKIAKDKMDAKTLLHEAIDFITSPNIGAYMAKKTGQKVATGEAQNEAKKIDPKKLSSAFMGGAKTTPGMIKQGGGIILNNIISTNRAIQDFFRPLDDAYTRILPQPIQRIRQGERAAKEQQLKISGDLALNLREEGTKSQQKALEEYAKNNTASTGLQGYLEMAAFNLPQMMTSVGLTAGTAIVTRNPMLASAVGVGTSYGMGASEVYNEARRFGLSDKEALPLAQIGGAIIGTIDYLPLGRLIHKTGGEEIVKKTLIKKLATGMAGLSIQAGFEGVTESIQEIIGNAIKQTYNEHQDLFEGTTEAFVVGTMLGGFSDVTVTGAVSVLGKDANPQQVAEDTQKRIETALDTPETERTTEQQQIVDALTTAELTPKEAIAFVATNDIEQTAEGKEIVKMAAEANTTDQLVKIKQSEDGSTLDIELIDKNFTPINITELQKESVSVQKNQLPVGEGKQKASKLEARMKGVIGKISDDQIKDLGLSTYQKMNRQETIGKAAEFVTNNPDEALEVLSGQREAPDGIPPEALYVAMLESIPSTQDAKQLTIATKLASLQATAIGQRLSLLAEIDPDSPVKLLNDIVKVREETARSKYGKDVTKAKTKAKNTAKKQIKKIDKYDWNDFINSIEC